MMFDLFKMLVEEPKKLWKLLFLFAKVSIITIFTAKLYTWFVGKYDVIDLSNIKSLTNFLLNGDIIICILLFSLSYIILFEVSTIVTSLILSLPNWVIKKISSDNNGIAEDDLAIFMLRLFGGVKFNKESKVLYATNPLKEVIDFFVELEKKESQEEILKLKNTTIDGILHFVLVFIFIFYFVLHYNFTQALSYLIIVLLVILSILYLEICLFIEYVKNNSKNLVPFLKDLELERKIFEHINKYTETKDSDFNLETYTTKEVTVRKEKYLMINYNKKQDLPSYFITDLNELHKKTEHKILLITNKNFTKNAKRRADVIKEYLKVIQYDDEETLFKKLDTFLKVK